MKFYSEKTKKFYDTDKECLDAELELEATEKEKKEMAEKLEAERKTRVEEIKAAYQKVSDAQKEAEELIKKFVEDYGSLQISGTADFFRLFDSLFF